MSTQRVAIYTYSATGRTWPSRSQEHTVRAYLADKDVRIVAVCNDCGPRPDTGLSDVLQDAVERAGKGGAVAMLSYDRLARRPEHWQARCDAITAAGVELIFAACPPDRTQEDYIKLAAFGAAREPVIKRAVKETFGFE